MRTGSRPLPLLLLLAGLFFYVLRATSWFDAVPGDLGDARFNSVILEHLFDWATGAAVSPWSPTFFYPAKGALAFSDNHFGSGAIYILMRLAGLSREHAFDGWFTVGCLLNFVAMYAVMRKLDFSPAASGVAGFIYAFSLPAMAQGNHAQLTYRFAIPLAYLSLLQFVRERRLSRLAQLAGWGALQFYCSIYLGLFMGYLLVATTIALLVPGLRPTPTRLAFRFGTPPSRWSPLLAIAVFTVATGYLLYQYKTIGKSYGFLRSPSDVLDMLPRPQSYLAIYEIPAYHWLGRMTAGLPMGQEHQMFMGFVPLLLGLWALLTGRRGLDDAQGRLLGLSFATLALLVAGTLYVGDRSLYQLVMTLPGVASIRAVSRIILVMALPVAILAALGTEKLLRYAATSWLVSALLIAALSFETLAYHPSRTNIDQWRDRLIPLAKAAQGAELRPGSVLYVTGRASEPFYLPEIDGMIFAQDRKIATLNGYSGNAPPGYVYPAPCTSPAVRVYSLANHARRRPDVAPDSLLARTVWLPLEKCTTPHVPTGAASGPPNEEQARNIELTLGSGEPDARMLNIDLRIENRSAATLHSLSQTGHPLGMKWRVVPQVEESTPEPAWSAPEALSFSLPPGEAQDIDFVIPRPASPGAYELQVMLQAGSQQPQPGAEIPQARMPIIVP